MRQRTEPSSSKDPSQFSRPLERSKLDKEEKTAKVNQRNLPSAKPTTPKVDSVPNKTALPSQPALQVLELLNEQFKKSSYDTYNLLRRIVHETRYAEITYYDYFHTFYT